MIDTYFNHITVRVTCKVKKQSSIFLKKTCLDTGSKNKARVIFFTVPINLKHFQKMACIVFSAVYLPSITELTRSDTRHHFEKKRLEQREKKKTD